MVQQPQTNNHGGIWQQWERFIHLIRWVANIFPRLHKPECDSWTHIIRYIAKINKVIEKTNYIHVRHSRQNIPNMHSHTPLDLTTYVSNACEQCWIMMIMTGSSMHKQNTTFGPLCILLMAHITDCAVSEEKKTADSDSNRAGRCSGELQPWRRVLVVNWESDDTTLSLSASRL